MTAPSQFIAVQEFPGERVVVLHNPDAPQGLRRVELGTIVSVCGGVGFLPDPQLAGLFSPDTLRTIADLMEVEHEPR